MTDSSSYQGDQLREILKKLGGRYGITFAEPEDLPARFNELHEHIQQRISQELRYKVCTQKMENSKKSRSKSSDVSMYEHIIDLNLNFLRDDLKQLDDQHSSVLKNMAVETPEQDKKPEPKRMGKVLHCCDCLSPIGVYAQNSVLRDQKVYCMKCHRDELRKRPCMKCKEVISSDFGKDRIDSSSLSFHKKCFVCAHCEEPMAVNQGYVCYEEKPYCTKCFDEFYAMRCEACYKVIHGIHPQLKDKHWHNDCYICTVCKKPLCKGKATMNKVSSNLVCRKCAP